MSKAPKRTSVAKAKAPEPTKGKYILTVNVNDRQFITDTDSISKALIDLGEQIIAFKTKVIIRASLGEKSVERVLSIPPAKMLFRNKVAAILFEKNLKNGLE